MKCEFRIWGRARVIFGLFDNFLFGSIATFRTLRCKTSSEKFSNELDELALSQGCHLFTRCTSTSDSNTGNTGLVSCLGIVKRRNTELNVTGATTPELETLQSCMVYTVTLTFTPEPRPAAQMFSIRQQKESAESHALYSSLIAYL